MPGVCTDRVHSTVQRFSAVLPEDGSTISLPAALKQVWRGCGGSGPEAALKLTVRWDLRKGGLHGPYVQAGCSHETQSPLRENQMPRGSLWIGDLGCFSLLWKLWKRWGAIDEWQTANPARIFCELYAKLLGMLVQHWLLLLSCWEDPHRSLVGAAHVIREQVPTLVHGLTGRLALGKALAWSSKPSRTAAPFPFARRV